MKEIKYKVLNKDLRSPVLKFQYEIGKEYVCDDYDDGDAECSRGFYATDVEGLVYSLRPGKRVFLAEMSGKSKKFNQYKQRWEKQKLISEISEEEVKRLLQEESKKIGYNIYEACYPINPLQISRERKIIQEEIDLLRIWASTFTSPGASVWDSVGNSVEASVGDSVWASVRNSVWASVWASVGDSIWASVMNSVWASVWDSVGAYISSLFPNITNWKHVDHPEGENPFQSCITLWRAGLVPSFDGKTWRLHSGEDTKIVYEMEKKNDQSSF